MPWSVEGANAGFSTAERTWLPLDERHRPLAVDAQVSDPGSMLAFTRALVALRAAEPALRFGRAEALAAPDGVLAFTRTLEGRSLTCVFELAGREARWSPSGEIILAVNSATSDGRLPPFGALVIRDR
jgi:alpha-glucosidase